VRGCATYLKLSNDQAGRTWAMEAITATATFGGLQR
jgi:hypothetical protein